MSEKIIPKDFALAVVSGNPVAGDTPDEKAKNALSLYLAAKEAVRNHNATIVEAAKSNFFG